MPQIEVSFDIDANGIMNVSAKDKQTGNQQSIVIKSSSGLDDAQIKRMVSDAEAHAEEDKRMRELVQERNRAEEAVYAVQKALRELGDKLPAEERKQAEAAIADVEEKARGDDRAAISQAAGALTELAAKFAAQHAQAQDSAQSTATADGNGN